MVAATRAVKKSSAQKKVPIRKSAPARRPKKPSVSAPAPAAPAPVVMPAPVMERAGRDFLTGIGRRKSAVASIRLYKNGTGQFVVNERPADAYFPVFELRNAIREPLVVCGQTDKLDISARVFGGGLRGQADAVALGVSRALLKLNQTFRRGLRKVGLLTRDARIKERKKPGLKRARRAPQWQKR